MAIVPATTVARRTRTPTVAPARPPSGAMQTRAPKTPPAVAARTAIARIRERQGEAGRAEDGERDGAGVAARPDRRADDREEQPDERTEDEEQAEVRRRRDARCRRRAGCRPASMARAAMTAPARPTSPIAVARRSGPRTTSDGGRADERDEEERHEAHRRSSDAGISGSPAAYGRRARPSDGRPARVPPGGRGRRSRSRPPAPSLRAAMTRTATAPAEGGDEAGGHELLEDRRRPAEGDPHEQRRRGAAGPARRPGAGCRARSAAARPPGPRRRTRPHCARAGPRAAAPRARAPRSRRRAGRGRRAASAGQPIRDPPVSGAVASRPAVADGDPEQVRRRGRPRGAERPARSASATGSASERRDDERDGEAEHGRPGRRGRRRRRPPRRRPRARRPPGAGSPAAHGAVVASSG